MGKTTLFLPIGQYVMPLGVSLVHFTDTRFKEQNIASSTSHGERLRIAWNAANEIEGRIDPSVGIPTGMQRDARHL